MLIEEAISTIQAQTIRQLTVTTIALTTATTTSVSVFHSNTISRLYILRNIYSEVLVLKKENVDFKNNIIYVKKSLTRNGKDQYIEGKKTKTYAGIREVPLSSFLKGILQNKPTIDGYYFKQANGKFLTPTIINAHIKRIAKDAHIRETIHKVHRIDKKTGKEKVINLKYSSLNTHCLRHTRSDQNGRIWYECSSNSTNTRTQRYTNNIKYLYISI